MCGNEECECNNDGTCVAWNVPDPRDCCDFEEKEDDNE